MQSAPTLTTPTLTPTTLRTIEETIYELTSDHQNAPYQAGFKPPPLTSLPNAVVNNNNNNNNNSVSNTASTAAVASTLAVVNANAINNQTPYTELLGLTPESDTEDSQGSWNENQLNDDQSTTDTCKLNINCSGKRVTHPYSLPLYSKCRHRQHIVSEWWPHDGQWIQWCCKQFQCRSGGS